jgi:small subunit ribosomal protein S20
VWIYDTILSKANIKSAKKRILQSNKKRLLNKSVKSELKTEIKKLLQLLHDPKSAGTEAQLLQLRKVEKHVDKAAGKKVIHNPLDIFIYQLICCGCRSSFWRCFFLHYFFCCFFYCLWDRGLCRSIECIILNA